MSPSETRIPAVVINLDRHAERLAWFSENARSVKLDFERIVAVDAKDEVARPQIESIRKPGNGLSDAEAACILSHRKAWQYLLDSEYPYLAIFEDDLHLSRDLPALLDRALIPDNAHLIKLEVPVGKVSSSKKPLVGYLGRSLHRLFTKAYGAAAYIVSRSCAIRLLAYTSYCEEPVDVVLFDDQSPIWREFGVLQIVPAPCIQDVNYCRLTMSTGRFESAIENDRSGIKAARKELTQKKKGRSLPFKKLRRYLSCVRQGADPFRYKVHVPLDLGYPGESAPEKR